MKKIAIIIQRYGTDVNGGAEYHCRLIAERLGALYDVTVLTSCATDHFSWQNVYPEGETQLNGIPVIRFAATTSRDNMKVHHSLRKMQGRLWWQRLAAHVKNWGLYLPGFPINLRDTAEEWSRNQGPFVPGLLNYIQNNQHTFDALIYFTYLYYPTFCGLGIAPHKSILIPTAHDEPAIHLPPFKSFFNLPAAILYNTRSEKRLVNTLFDNDHIYSDIVGVGIDEVQTFSSQQIDSLLDKKEAYVIYIGRVDPGKGCDVLFDYFLQYKKKTSFNIKLVVVGKADMDIPADSDIVQLGFVEEDYKVSLLAGAKALIMPSHFESLSMVTLESMQAGIPVIANHYCEVLRDHILNSEGGFTYRDQKEFAMALDHLLEGGVAIEEMQKKAKRYVEYNYNWGIVLAKLTKAIEHVSSGGTENNNSLKRNR